MWSLLGKIVPSMPMPSLTPWMSSSKIKNIIYSFGIFHMALLQEQLSR